MLKSAICCAQILEHIRAFSDTEPGDKYSSLYPGIRHLGYSKESRLSEGLPVNPGGNPRN